MRTSQMNQWMRWCALAALGSAFCAGGANGQSGTDESTIETGATSGGHVAPLPSGEQKILQALVIGVEGNVRWRPTPDEPLRELRVDDILDTGAEIRTALRSSTTLRIGHNATVEIQSVSRVLLPEMVQDGDVLRTRAMVAGGRADFKVDQVGLTNDFEVVTPSTTLAVRGTWFGVQYGGLFGTTIGMFDPNHISRAEVSYFVRNQRSVMVSNGQRTRESQPNPVLNALFNTISPPPDATQGSSQQKDARAARLNLDQNSVRDDRRILRDVDQLSLTQSALGITPTDPRGRASLASRPRNGGGMPPGVFGGSGNATPGRDGPTDIPRK